MKQKLFLIGTVLALTGGVISFRNTLGTQVNADDGYTHVTDYAELLKAVETTKAEKIMLDNDITIDRGDVKKGEALKVDSNMEIDGNNHILQVDVTGYDDKGYFNENPFGVYLIHLINESSLTIKNITIRGGKTSAIYSQGATGQPNLLKIYNSTIERTGGPDDYGAGIYNKKSRVYMENSKLSRNAGEYGGGFLNEDGWFILDSCSMNENRSLGYGKGGGGCENKGDGYCIFNNCTIANNASTEIGGAINNATNLVLINTTIVGNLTNCGIDCGGGVGLNDTCLSVYNSLITNNYYDADTRVFKSDVSVYSYEYDSEYPDFVPSIDAYATKTASVADLSGSYPLDIPGLEIVEAKTDDFIKMVNQSAVLYDSTINFYVSNGVDRPYISLNDAGTYSCYLSHESAFLSGGCKTYFYVPDDLSTWGLDTIVAGYMKDGQYEACMGTFGSYFVKPTNENYLVDKYQDGETRAVGTIGASGSRDKITDVCLSVYPGNRGSRSDFGSPYGELFPLNTPVTINPVLADPSDQFLYWEDCEDSSITYPIDYFVNFPLDRDYSIRPFIDGDCAITNLSEYIEDNPSGGYIEAPEKVPYYSKIDVVVHADDGYSLAFLFMDNSITYEFTADLNNLRSKETDIEMEAYFWTGKNPEGVDDIVYDGNAHNLIEAGINGELNLWGSAYDEEGHFEYCLTGLNKDYSTTIPTATEVGDYTVFWRYTGDNVYIDRGGDFDVSIIKQEITKPIADTTAFVYNGENQTYSILTNDAYMISDNVKKEAGNYTVTVALKDKTNTCWADGSTDDLSFNFVINKAKVAKPEADTTAFKFNGEDQTYTIAANSAYEITGNVAKDAGTHTVTVALKDKTNTCWSDGSINDLIFDFIIAEEDKACFLHWISIGLLVVAAALLVLHIVLKYKALIAYVALGVIDAGAVVTGLLGFILNNCFFCLGTLIGNFVIISLMIVFTFLYSKKKKEDKDERKAR